MICSGAATRGHTGLAHPKDMCRRHSAAPLTCEIRAPGRYALETLQDAGDTHETGWDDKHVVPFGTGTTLQ